MKVKGNQQKDDYLGGDYSYNNLQSIFQLLYWTLEKLCHYKWYLFLHVIAALKHTSMALDN